jgi:hypothetical protein
MEKIKNVRTGDIIAFKTKAIWYNPLTWLGPIIRKIAKIEYNHVGVIVELYNKPFVFEAIDKGFLPMSFEEKIKDKEHIKDFVILTIKCIFFLYGLFSTSQLPPPAVWRVGWKGLLGMFYFCLYFLLVVSQYLEEVVRVSFYHIFLFL